jgi:hypothetical protein
MSQRGDRVACPSRRRSPSVTRTPQLVIFVLISGSTEAAGYPAVKTVPALPAAVVALVLTTGQNEHDAQQSGGVR